MPLFRVKVELSKWLENCSVGRFSDVVNVQSVKESFLCVGSVL